MQENYRLSDKQLFMATYYDSPEQHIFSERTEKETDKKCPQCGATVTYDPATGMMHCEYCGYTREVPNAGTKTEFRELDFESALHTESFNWGEQKKQVQCKQCGAVTIYDALETAAVCPFCGSTSVMPAATENTIAPGGVCPFTITKEQAGANFQKWLKRKWFIPRKAKKSASPEAFCGVYLPYWTFDAQSTSEFTARAGYDSTESDDDGGSHTSTDWKRVSGVYQEFLDDVTVVASKRNEDSGVKDCEPFDFSRMIPYTPQALAGFIAERYSIGLKEGWEMAQQTIQSRLKKSIEKFVKKHWGADHADRIKFSTVFEDITYKYIIVPTWISSFKYKNKIYQFVVNGQTGKVGDKAPLSIFRITMFWILLIGVFALLLYLNKDN